MVSHVMGLSVGILEEKLTAAIYSQIDIHSQQQLHVWVSTTVSMIMSNTTRHRQDSVTKSWFGHHFTLYAVLPPKRSLSTSIQVKGRTGS